jgi:hypothetical protein
MYASLFRRFREPFFPSRYFEVGLGLARTKAGCGLHTELELPVHDFVSADVYVYFNGIGLHILKKERDRKPALVES